VIDEAYSTSKEPAKIPKVQEAKAAKKVESKPTISKLSPPATIKKPIENKPSVADIKPVKASETSKPDLTTAKPSLKLNCPRTNFEFERDWKTYKGRGDDVLYQYFKVDNAESAMVYKRTKKNHSFWISVFHLQYMSPSSSLLWNQISLKR
jgi:hypothetical protein